MVDGFERLGTDLAQQFIDHFDIVRLGEEIGDGLSHRGADAFDIVELGIGLAGCGRGQRQAWHRGTPRRCHRRAPAAAP